MILCQRLTHLLLVAQKIEFSIKDFFSKCDQIRRKLRVWSRLLKKFLMENFNFFWAVTGVSILYPSGDVRKPLVFWLFRGLCKWKTEMKWFMYQFPIILFNQFDSAKITILKITENL